LARQYGASDEVLDTLDDLAKSPLPEREKAALRFAEKMTTSHGEISREDVDGLREHWSEEEIVEMACVAGLFNYLNRFAVAFALEPTRPGEGGPDDREGERPRG
jgi:alkylhydroperoxidase family enzyme